MSLPAGLATFTLTGGAFTDVTGLTALAKVRGALTPVDGAGRPMNVIHSATGKVIVPIDIPIEIADDGTWSVSPLPYTDDPAFAGPFRYKVTWNVAPFAPSPGTKVFEVPTGSGSVIDFDLLGSSTGSTVTPVAVPLVTSVAGASGAVTSEQIAAALDVEGTRLSDARLRAAFVAANGPRAGVGRNQIVVATGSWATPAAANQQTAAGTSRSVHVAVADCSDLRLVYGGWNVADGAVQGIDTDNAASYPVSASIEYGGTIYRATFGGRTVATIDPGGTAISDPVGVQIPAGATFYVRTYLNSTAWYPNVASYATDGSTGGWAAGDLTAPGAGAVANVVHWMFTPFAVLGSPANRAVPTVAIVGDSISVGVYDGPGVLNYVAGGGGYIHRALTAGSPPVGYLHVGHGGQTAHDWTFDTNRFRRIALLNGCTHAVVELGVNDVMNSGASLATAQADLTKLWGYLTQRGMKVWQTTITPRTTSTDSWATTANQTTFNAGWEAVREQLNDWIRTTPAGLTGYFEVADLSETARNSGIWKAGYTPDGLHPNATGAAALAAGIDVTKLV